MALGPFDPTDGPFLILYIALFLAALAAGILLPRRLRPEGRRCRLEEVEQLAFLSGGARRFREAVVAGLVARGALVLGRDRHRAGFRRGARDRARSAAEHNILSLPPPIRWHEIAEALEPCIALLRRRMVAAGLLASDGDRAWLRLWAMLPWLMLLGFGAVLWLRGAAGRPFLLALLAVTIIVTIVRGVTVDERTRAGVEALREARLRNTRLLRAPTRAEVPLAVALFGTDALAATPWVQLHRESKYGHNGSCGGGGGACGGGSAGGSHGSWSSDGASGGCGNNSGCGGGGGCGGCGGG